MGIDKNYRSLLAHFLDRDLERLKRIFEDWLHERPCLDIDHTHGPLRRFEHDRAAAGSAHWIIHRAQQTRLRVNESDDFFLIPDVIPSRYHRDARAQEIDGDSWRDSTAARGVLAVDDNEVDCVRFLQARQLRDHGAAAWLAYNVAEKKNRQHPASIVLNRRKSKP